VAVSLPDQPRQERRVAAHHRHQVQVENPLPFPHRKVIGKAAPADVVHHDVHGAEAVQGECLKIVKRIVVQHITADTGRVSTGDSDLRGHRLGAVAVDVGRDDPGTAVGQRNGGRPADTARGAGDDRDLVRQRLH
jgi:hypothetical protein